MLTVLGLFAMAGSLAFGFTAFSVEWKAAPWAVILYDAVWLTASIACLGVAYVCFGGVG
jgi:hypothetical protein